MLENKIKTIKIVLKEMVFNFFNFIISINILDRRYTKV